MYRSCSRCGKIHDVYYTCSKNKSKINYSRYTDSDEYRLRNTYAWHNKSEEIKKKSRYLCSVCEDEGVYNYSDLEVHHIIKLRDDDSRLLDDYNLVCLCVKHHKLADRNMINKEYLFNLAKEREERYYTN